MVLARSGIPEKIIRDEKAIQKSDQSEKNSHSTIFFLIFCGTSRPSKTSDHNIDDSLFIFPK